MERTTRVGGGMMAIFVVLVLVNGVDAETLYSCWGTCYTSCFMGNNQSQSDKFSCDYECLKSCLPPPSHDLHSYCQIGCSMKRCIPVSIIDGAKKESCFDWCTNLCNKMLNHD